MISVDEAKKIQDYIAKQAMKNPEWAIAYALLEVSGWLRYVGDIIAGPIDDTSGLNRIGAELGRIADRMQGHETEAQRKVRKAEEKAALSEIEGFELEGEGVRVSYKNGDRKLMGKEEGVELCQRWRAIGGGQ
jgi:hypothetical protein